MDLRADRPAAIAPADIARFVAFVGDAGEVNLATLPGLVGRAVSLVRLFVDDALVGTAAIKMPDPGHRSGEFRKAGVECLADDFPLELGWIVVHPDHRKQGYDRRLVDCALRQIPERALYCTTKSETMRTMLPEFGFRPEGHNYPSARQPKIELTLFVRDADAGPEAAA